MTLSLLTTHVRDWLAENDVPAVVVFGQRELAQHLQQGSGRANRVVFAPGDDGRGLGSYGPPSKRAIFGANVPNEAHPPRSLWTWTVSARVLIWAHDGTAPNDEAKQWDALCDLHDHVVTAIHTFASGSVGFRSPRDPSAVVERRFGQAVMLVLDLAQHVVDVRTVERTGPLVGRGAGVLVSPSANEEAPPTEEVVEDEPDPEENSP